MIQKLLCLFSFHEWNYHADEQGSMYRHCRWCFLIESQPKLRDKEDYICPKCGYKREYDN